MSAKLDLCFVEVTDLIREAVRHVLNQAGCDERLQKELAHWQSGLSESAEKKGNVVPVYCREEEAIPFEFLFKIHQQLKITPLASGPIYLHELMNGSSVCLPEVKFPPRNPDLVARLERVQAMADNKEYKRMVKNVDVSRDDSEFYSLGLEVQATSRQIWAVVNFIVTVVGAFVFGYFAAYFAGYSIPVCVSVGLICGTVVFMADLYFLVRTDLVPPKTKSRVKQKTD